MNKEIKWITRTAALIALLLVWQMIMAPLGINLILGSVVNLILIISILFGGFACGLTVAVVSPVFAAVLGIGGMPIPLSPFIIPGNLALVLVWHYVGKLKFAGRYVVYPITAVCAAALKFAVLYLSVVKIAMSVLSLPAAFSVAFSFPQFFTALIGGALAVAITPVLRKALKADK